MIRLIALATVLAATAACTENSGDTASAGSMAANGPGARAEIRDASGKSVGTAIAMQHGDGIHIDVKAMGIPAGVHGIHVHTVGKCDAPDFTTAGGHWNPTTMKHGTQNPQGPHAGDMPNLTAAADGRGELSIMLPSGTLSGLLDADGSAIVIHASADDMMTDPSGNSGGRIACGVFSAN